MPWKDKSAKLAYGRRYYAANRADQCAKILANRRKRHDAGQWEPSRIYQNTNAKPWQYTRVRFRDLWYCVDCHQWKAPWRFGREHTKARDWNSCRQCEHEQRLRRQREAWTPGKDARWRRNHSRWLHRAWRYCMANGIQWEARNHWGHPKNNREGGTNRHYLMWLNYRYLHGQSEKIKRRRLIRESCGRVSMYTRTAMALSMRTARTA